MAEIAEINRFPLTGARAEKLYWAQINAAGIIGDRVLIAYDTTDEEPVDRIGQKQMPRLAQLDATYGDRRRYVPGGLPIQNGGVEISKTWHDNGWSVRIPSDGTEPITVNEFGDATPCQRLELHESVEFQIYRALMNESIGLARKSDLWLAGGIISPEARAVAPLHIITQASVRKLQAQAENPQFGVERFRANLVIDGDFEPNSEQAWVGKVIKVGDALIRIHRGTKRCIVTSFDQLTGQNKKDVPKLFKYMPKAADDNKPLFGVYGYPLVEKQVPVAVEVSLGDTFEVL
ncbi:MAG: MOSC domain-containing protein [Candidatus Saccharimonadales bacterium]